jgi:hypothetical protein
VEVLEDIVDCHAATLRAGEMGRLRLVTELGLEARGREARVCAMCWGADERGLDECWE